MGGVTGVTRVDVHSSSDAQYRLTMSAAKSIQVDAQATQQPNN